MHVDVPSHLAVREFLNNR